MSCAISSQRGFTFIETLVAISILLLALVGPLTLSYQGLRVARVARDQVVATYLIQEAIEYVRWQRDTNILNGDSWLNGLTLCSSGNECTLDVHDDASPVVICQGAAGCPALMYDPPSGYYTHQELSKQTVETLFTRSFTVTQLSGEEAIVTAEVRWQDGISDRTLTATENIFEWQ